MLEESKAVHLARRLFDQQTELCDEAAAELLRLCEEGASLRKEFKKRQKAVFRLEYSLEATKEGRASRSVMADRYRLGYEKLKVVNETLIDAIVCLLNVEHAALLGAQMPGMKHLDVPYHFEKARAALAKAE